MNDFETFFRKCEIFDYFDYILPFFLSFYKIRLIQNAYDNKYKVLLRKAVKSIEHGLFNLITTKVKLKMQHSPSC